MLANLLVAALYIAFQKLTELLPLSLTTMLSEIGADCGCDRHIFGTQQISHPFDHQAGDLISE